MNDSLIRWDALAETRIHRGHHRRQVEFETCYVALHRYGADGEGYDLHSHVETQVGLVLEGAMAMMFEERPITVSAGRSYIIPSALSHGGKAAGEESLVLNLYVKKAFVATPGDGARCDEWNDARPPVISSGVRQSRLRLALGETPPAHSRHAVDAYDVIVEGRLGPLVRRDVFRHAGGSPPAAGEEGALLFRVEILKP